MEAIPELAPVIIMTLFERSLSLVMVSAFLARFVVQHMLQIQGRQQQHRISDKQVMVMEIIISALSLAIQSL